MYVEIGEAFDWRAAYKLLIGAVNPRPIGLISSISADGLLNLAPFSFFNMCSANPPVLMFVPSLNRRREHKHSYSNVVATREFVVAIVTREIAPQMVRSAAELPAGQSEFEFAGLTPVPAKRVRPPLVKESPVNIECRLRQVVSMGERPGSGQVVFGDIVALHVADEVLRPERDAIDPRRLQTVGRLGEQYYCDVTQPYVMEIPEVPGATTGG
jgi:flavin reductase (DIM6/NTAB) family NADH-FMN oxidoreductase RutF